MESFEVRSLDSRGVEARVEKEAEKTTEGERTEEKSKGMGRACVYTSEWTGWAAKRTAVRAAGTTFSGDGPKA